MASRDASYPGENWESIPSPEEVGWSSERLQQARAFAKEIGSAAVLVITGGKILVQWGETDRRFRIHSIRKSILSTLYGPLVESGRLQFSSTLEELGIDDTPPPLSTEEKQATVYDLLTSRSGVYHVANIQNAERRPLRGSHPPGIFYYYNNWDFNTLGTIFEQCTKASLFESFASLLAQPLRMQDFHWDGMLTLQWTMFEDFYVQSAHQIRISVDEIRARGINFLRQFQWQEGMQTPLTSSSQAETFYTWTTESLHPAFGWRISARDLARLGLLVLRKGQWQGQQLIPSTWIEEMLMPRVRFGKDSGIFGSRLGSFGYLWWLSTNGELFPHVTLPPGTCASFGNGGHWVLILPELDMVIVHRTNTDSPDGPMVPREKSGQFLRHLLAAREQQQ